LKEQIMNPPVSFRVVAAIVDTAQLTLFREDGSTTNLLQGDPRLAPILKNITPILATGGVATVTLDTPPNTFADYEQESGGLVKFFRVAKSALSRFLSRTPEPVTPQVLGNVPQRIPVSVAGAIFVDKTLVSAQQAQTAKIMGAVDEIMAHAVPASAPDFMTHEVGDKSQHTVIAQVGGVLIPGVEKIRNQLSNATTRRSTKGTDAFMQRIGAVVSQRNHSIQDLLKFLEKGDLPIADDGSIVIYKILRRAPKGDGYVDCYTRRVPQKIGSYVCMDPKLVDPDRSIECSQGLHVARRAYINQFNGDVVVLAKVAPEDVIAVPHNDPNKMRVAGYHILFELSEEAYAKLKGNRPFTDNEEAQLLLGRALAGDHVGRLEEVRITEPDGYGVVVTPLTSLLVTPPTTTITASMALPDEIPMEEAPSVNPNTVQKEVDALVSAALPTRKEAARQLYSAFTSSRSKIARKDAAQALLDYKKRVKQGWSALGLSDSVAAELVSATN